ncbi:cyclic nucleotide-binding domain-containing protein [Streptomyces flavofungini]|uniref:Cyclic nucleotide-binding domain-containing protein n=1 Tax=Streptomyces flavofungini TaxID=68200 RepID=A0ABS0XHF9_9ACTN|nr:cyclic nucleotide-binding domain-containing protein [Streptomyces flavofungini]MBJ3812650.1 cyclic nucleotide-binding domain-containing protein [Streptomyces flavofungini]
MNTTTTSTIRITQALSAEYRTRLLRSAREVSIPQGTRLFEEGGRADRFWIVRTGTVTLDMYVPGRRSPVIETIGIDELVGWSWLFPPYVWQLGAEATTPVRAYEFDAVAVRLMCEHDPQLGAAVGQWVGKVLAHRLQSARTRLLDLYAPYGSGSAL